MVSIVQQTRSCWHICPRTHNVYIYIYKVKGKVLPYSLLSVWLGADPGVQAVSPQVTFKVIPGGRLPLLFVITASLPHKRSSDGATADWGGEHLIAAHYSVIYPERMKGSLWFCQTLRRRICLNRKKNPDSVLMKHPLQHCENVVQFVEINRTQVAQ